MPTAKTERLADSCVHCGGALDLLTSMQKGRLLPYKVVCAGCGVNSAWCGSAQAAWRSVQRQVPPAKSWRCFHCDEVFVSEHCARLHFGYSEEAKPACLVAAETGLLEQYRRVEDELAKLRWQTLEEDTEAARAHYGHMARHATALRQAEEIGYAKGLADGRALGSRAAPG